MYTHLIITTDKFMKSYNMKITNKHLQILAGIFFLLATIIIILTGNYNKTHVTDPNIYGRWIGISLFFVGFFLLMPWGKKKDN